MSSSAPQRDDPLGISQLSQTFEQLIAKITERVQLLTSQVLQSVEREQEVISGAQLATADAEIKRLRGLIAQCEEFDVEFAKIGQIADFAKEFKVRIMALEKELT